MVLTLAILSPQHNISINYFGISHVAPQSYSGSHDFTHLPGSFPHSCHPFPKEEEKQGKNTPSLICIVHILTGVWLNSQGPVPIRESSSVRVT